LKPLLIIKTGQTFPTIATRYGDFEDWIISGIAVSRENFLIISPFLSQPLPPATEISGVIITGSHAMVSDAEAWSVKTANWLRDIAATKIPLLGICYGHQLIAEALGGKVGFHPKGREIGSVKIAKTVAAKSDPLFYGLPENLTVHVAHAQSVINLPQQAELLAKNDFEPHHAFVIDNHIWGLQFHPEFTQEITKAYIHALKNTLKNENFDIPQLLSLLRPSQFGNILLKRFYAICSQNQIS